MIDPPPDADEEREEEKEKEEGKLPPEPQPSERPPVGDTPPANDDDEEDAGSGSGKSKGKKEEEKAPAPPLTDPGEAVFTFAVDKDGQHKVTAKVTGQRPGTADHVKGGADMGAKAVEGHYLVQVARAEGIWKLFSTVFNPYALALVLLIGLVLYVAFRMSTSESAYQDVQDWRNASRRAQQALRGEPLTRQTDEYENQFPAWGDSGRPPVRNQDNVAPYR